MTDRTLYHHPDKYDVQIDRTIPHYRDFLEETIGLLRSMEQQPKLWLDTGCGTGAIVNMALDSFPSTRFILADPSEKMLEQARNKLEGHERVTFLPPTCTQDLKGLVTERPDVITAIQCHHYLSREVRKNAVDVCFDLLAEGGTFVTFENVRPFTDLGIGIGKKRWGRYQSAMGKGEADVDKHLARFDSVYFPITVEEHLALLRGAGFRAVELLWYSHMQAGFYCLK